MFLRINPITFNPQATAVAAGPNYGNSLGSPLTIGNSEGTYGGRRRSRKNKTKAKGKGKRRGRSTKSRR